MRTIRDAAMAMTLSVTLTLSLLVHAEQAASVGDYEIHYNAFTTDTLQPAVASAYKITRSKNRGMLTVSILEKVLGTLGKPVAATVKGTASNLTGQLKTLDIREIREGNAIYYIGEFPVSDQEVLDFDLTVRLPGQQSPATIKFRKQFFTD
jgi:Domain of unknown function (DUF4426)